MHFCQKTEMLMYKAGGSGQPGDSHKLDWNCWTCGPTSDDADGVEQKLSSRKIEVDFKDAFLNVSACEIVQK